MLAEESNSDETSPRSPDNRTRTNNLTANNSEDLVQASSSLNCPPITLYWDPIPPPCQAVQLTALALDIPLRLQRVDVMKNEQIRDSFLHINPLHQLPVLELTDGFKLTESRAIMVYLADVAGQRGQALYPSEVRARAACHRWMWFDVTCLWHRLKAYHMPVVELCAGRLLAAALPPLHEALDVLETQLKTLPFAAGCELTLADLGLVTSIAQARAVGADLSSYTAIAAWYETVRDRVPGMTDVVRGSEDYAAILKQLMDSWKEDDSQPQN